MQLAEGLLLLLGVLLHLHLYLFPFLCLLLLLFLSFLFHLRWFLSAVIATLTPILLLFRPLSLASPAASVCGSTRCNYILLLIVVFSFIWGSSSSLQLFQLVCGDAFQFLVIAALAIAPPLPVPVLPLLFVLFVLLVLLVLVVPVMLFSLLFNSFIFHEGFLVLDILRFGIVI